MPVVELMPVGAGLDARALGGRVDTYRFHCRQVEHQPTVAGGLAGDVVAAATHGQQQLVVSREIDGLHHVAGTGGTHDGRGVAVDHAVPQRA
jgi:hypothetical protein